ncbi:MAG: DUF4321 domain-containing protein [Bacillaceae bacterium]|nr:DUF4321 domain-containing protein [Bacillaceae bacterium]
MNIKSTLVLLVLLLSGMIFGNLLGKLLGPWIPFLKMSETIVWQPRGDFGIIQYDFWLQIQMNLAGLIGIVLAIWLYKKFI